MTARNGGRALKRSHAPQRPKRRHERRPAELPVVLEDAANRVRGKIRFESKDLSAGGAFLRSDLLFEVGEELCVEFTLPRGRTIKARGRVVRVSREGDHGSVPGMGIEFLGLTDADRKALQAFITKA